MPLNILPLLEHSVMSDDEQLTLLEEYLAMEKSIQKCQDSHAFATSTERDLHMAETLAKIQHLDNRIETSDLFSPNEIADDIATPSLKYLLVAFTLGDFLLSMPSNIDTRAKYVHDAYLAFKRFLDRMELLLLLNEEAKREVEGKEPTDPVVLRQKKLQQFKREKLLREQLTALSAARQRAADEARARGACEDGDALEREREVVLLAIEACIDKAVQHLRFIAREQELLAHHEKQREMQRAEVFRTGAAESASTTTSTNTTGPRTTTGTAHAHGPSGSSGAVNGPPVDPPRPLKVHSIGDRDGASAPIPAHMRDYMQHVQAPKQQTQQQQQQQQRQHQCANANCECDEERLMKPWFSAQAHDSCTHCDDDVRTRPQYAEYMITKKRGGRGQLVPACPLHGNAHPAGECPGLLAGVGGASRGAAGYPDPVDALVARRGDRHSVFKDSNPYLMELDDWVLMKQREGALPGERDQQLAERMRAQYEAHAQRVEDGLSDDEEQLKSRAQEEEEEEEAQMKARAWADWADDHEKGAGNKNYRR